jgi:hypothetical protein
MEVSEGPIMQIYKKNWNYKRFAERISFMHKILRERETITNMEVLDSDYENFTIQPQVEYSTEHRQYQCTEDFTDDEVCEATTEHTETQKTNDGHAREYKGIPFKRPFLRHHRNVCHPLNHCRRN